MNEDRNEANPTRRQSKYPWAFAIVAGLAYAAFKYGFAQNLFSDFQNLIRAPSVAIWVEDRSFECNSNTGILTNLKVRIRNNGNERINCPDAQLVADVDWESPPVATAVLIPPEIEPKTVSEAVFEFAGLREEGRYLFSCVNDQSDGKTKDLNRLSVRAGKLNSNLKLALIARCP